MELMIALVLFAGMIAAWMALPGQTLTEEGAEPAAPEPAPFPAGAAAV